VVSHVCVLAVFFSFFGLVQKQIRKVKASHGFWACIHADDLAGAAEQRVQSQTKHSKVSITSMPTETLWPIPCLPMRLVFYSFLLNIHRCV
jgi:hypothetical protein